MKPWVLVVVIVVWLFLGIVATSVNESGGAAEHAAAAPITQQNL